MTENIKNKDQYNGAIEYYSKFENKFSLSDGPPMELLSIVTISLKGGKKNRETITVSLK